MLNFIFCIFFCLININQFLYGFSTRPSGRGRYFTRIDDPELKRSRNIYLFGDCHVDEFYGIPDCYPTIIGQTTLHRLGRDKLDVLNLTDYNCEFRDGDAVVFSFGQIDVGWHICKIRDKQHRDLNEIIMTLAVGYIDAINLITQNYPNLIKVIYSITPPTDYTHVPEKPYIGSLRERVLITKQLNNLIKSMCPMNGIEFLDVYDDYSDENGVLTYVLSDHSHHIERRYNCMIKRRLYDILNRCP